MLFEELGFAYIGVIDGHDIGALREAMRQAIETAPGARARQDRQGQGLRAGRGAPGEVPRHQAVRLGNGDTKAVVEGMSYTDAFGDALVRLAEQDQRVVGITAAMTQGTGLDGFEERFPGRFFDVGIAEQHAVMFASGLAIGGMRPVGAIYSTFLQRAFDMIVHDVCLQQPAVVFAMDRAGLVGDDGPTHHGAFDLSYLRLIPNIDRHGAVEPRRAAAHAAHGAEPRRPGRDPLPARHGDACSTARPSSRCSRSARGVVLEEGQDVALVGIGTGVGIARAAAERLRPQGVRPTVVDARFVKPLDTALLDRLASAHRRIVTVEENVLAGGFGSAVLEHLPAAGVEIVRLGIPDAFVPHGDRARLLADIGLTPEAVAAAAAGRPVGLAQAR